MKKRIAALLLSAVLMLSLPPTALAAESAPTVSVSSATVYAGETASVSISLANNPGIISLRLRIAYDTSVMTLTGVEDQGCFQSVTYAGDSASMAKSPYTILWHSATSAQPSTVNGVITTLKFTVKADAADGSYPVSVTYQTGDILDFDLKRISFSVKNGAVTVRKADGSGALGDTVQWFYSESAGELQLRGTLPQGGMVYLAQYDGSGRMIGLEQAIVGNCYAIAKQGRASLFLLGSGSHAPVCENVQITANHSGS